MPSSRSFVTAARALDFLFGTCTGTVLGLASSSPSALPVVLFDSDALSSASFTSDGAELLRIIAGFENISSFPDLASTCFPMDAASFLFSPFLASSSSPPVGGEPFLTLAFGETKDGACMAALGDGQKLYVSLFWRHASHTRTALAGPLSPRGGSNTLVPVEHAWQTTRPQLLQWWRCDLRRVHSANFFWQTKMEHLSASLSGCHNLQGTCRPVTNPLAPDGMPLSGVPCSIEEPCEDTCEFVGDIGRASVASSSFEEVGVDGASRNKHGSEHAVLVLAYSVLKRDLVVAIMTFRCGSPPRGVSLPHTTPNDFGTQSRKKSFR
mmetsp:Transcript_81006/g.121771  ORF Transcript_81006/g.121771 Transcript_81006/m.121771 type:complete len:323 (-) Transcript_81006:84-1052(-)